MTIDYVVLKKEEMDSLKSLWEELRTMHAEKSIHFENWFRRFTFEYRKAELTEAEDVNLLAVRDAEEPIGYCISTFNRGEGNIESLYIKEAYRKFGIGNELMKRSLEWIDEHHPDSVFVTVAAGNEAVLDFYRKFGFEISTLKLKMTEKTDL